jgi:hypothetical protein
LGAQISALEDVRTPVQGQLFGAAKPATEGGSASDSDLQRATAGMDALRRKFGPGAVVPASLLGKGKR